MADAAERKRAERARKRQQGLAKLELWIPAALADRVRKAAARVVARESKRG